MQIPNIVIIFVQYFERKTVTEDNLAARIV